MSLKSLRSQRLTRSNWAFASRTPSFENLHRPETRLQPQLDSILGPSNHRDIPRLLNPIHVATQHCKSSMLHCKTRPQSVYGPDHPSAKIIRGNLESLG